MYGEADVVVSCHGGSLANAPLLESGRLLVEVFSNPGFRGTALSYFLGIGSRCGALWKDFFFLQKASEVTPLQGSDMPAQSDDFFSNTITFALWFYVPPPPPPPPPPSPSPPPPSPPPPQV